MSTEDQNLLVGLQAGRRKAAEELVRRLEPMVTRVVFRLTGWHDQVEDLVQETFLAMQQSADTFRGQSSLETWVYGIALNCCRGFNRTRHRYSDNESEVETLCAPHHNLSETGEHVSETREHVHFAIAKLDQEARELIVSRYLEELSLAEMSDLFQIRKNTLEVKLHRARKRLGELLQEDPSATSKPD